LGAHALHLLGRAQEGDTGKKGIVGGAALNRNP
jgi:hypothetical protein